MELRHNRPDGYSFDANGNMLNDGENTMTYDAENRAVTAADSAYVYDGNGLRVQKCTPNCTNPTTSTVYIFSGAQVADEYDNGAAPASSSREYVYSGGTLLAKIEAGATNYYHPDQLSNRLLTDSSGNLVGQQGHYPFGELWYPTSGPVTKWLFTSYERDSQSGNDYALARHYVNRFRRFLSPDPLGGEGADPQSLDRYAYVLDDPRNNIDPLGLSCVETKDDIVCFPDAGGGIVTAPSARKTAGVVAAGEPNDRAKRRPRSVWRMPQIKGTRLSGSISEPRR